MKAVTPDAGFSWSDISAFPGLDTPESAEIVVLAKALAQATPRSRSRSAPRRA
jgi:hypothetical protein